MVVSNSIQFDLVCLDLLICWLYLYLVWGYFILGSFKLKGIEFYLLASQYGWVCMYVAMYTYKMLFRITVCVFLCSIACVGEQ